MNKKEFLEFMKIDQVVPSRLDDQVVNKQGQLIALFKRLVVTKVFVVHALAGFITLFFCPQFGFNPFAANPHIPHIFMEFGVWACGIFCGALFIGSGSLLLALYLRRDEKAFYRNHNLILPLTITGCFLFIMMIFGIMHNGLDVYLTVSFISFWLIGGILSEKIIFTTARRLTSHAF